MNLKEHFPYRDKKILYAALNWGLGHATRSIPIIELLLEQKNSIILASDGASLKLLRSEFPSLQYFKLPSYAVRYTFDSMAANMIMQLPKFLYTYLKEIKVTRALHNQENFDIIISDHRYGARHQKVSTNIFIGHQINIMNSQLKTHKLASMLNRYLINKFDVCYIPDNPGVQSLAGTLSLSDGLRNYTYIGPLSRLSLLPEDIVYHAVIVLSGPEPKRSEFEKNLLCQIEQSTFRFFLVRGVFNDKNKIPNLKNLTVVNHLTRNELNILYSKSRLIISRAGYSSIMDFRIIQKQVILIPTPGQTEQLYLANHLADCQQFEFYKEAEFELDKTISKFYELN